MKNWGKILSLFALLTFIVINMGCNRSEFYPESDIKVIKVEPFNIIPTSSSLAEVEDAVVTLQLLNTVPCNLLSYDLTFRTVQNDSIDNLNMYDVPISIPLTTAGEDVEVTLKPYTQQLFDLYDSSVSSISPVRATFKLYFKDVNKNEIIKEANFLLYKYEESSSDS